jgi:hypothetical protein
MLKDPHGILNPVDRLECSQLEIRRVLDLQILIMQFTAEDTQYSHDINVYVRSYCSCTLIW